MKTAEIDKRVAAMLAARPVVAGLLNGAGWQLRPVESGAGPFDVFCMRPLVARYETELELTDRYGILFKRYPHTETRTMVCLAPLDTLLVDGEGLWQRAIVGSGSKTGLLGFFRPRFGVTVRTAKLRGEYMGSVSRGDDEFLKLRSDSRRMLVKLTGELRIWLADVDGSVQLPDRE